MANIQASINQGISLATLLATQSPTFKEAAEKRSKLKALDRKEKAIIEARDIAAGKNEDGTMSTKEAEAYQEELQAIKKEQFEVDPSAEAFKAYKEAAPYGEVKTTFPEDPEVIAQEMYEEELRKKEVEDYLNFYRGNTEPTSPVNNDPYAELFRKYGADAYTVADTHSQDAQRRLAEIRRRNREVVYGSEADSWNQINSNEDIRKRNKEVIYGSEND